MHLLCCYVLVNKRQTSTTEFLLCNLLGLFLREDPPTHHDLDKQSVLVLHRRLVSRT